MVNGGPRLTSQDSLDSDSESQEKLVQKMEGQADLDQEAYALPGLRIRNLPGEFNPELELDSSTEGTKISCGPSEKFLQEEALRCRFRGLMAFRMERYQQQRQCQQPMSAPDAVKESLEKNLLAMGINPQDI